MVFLPVLPAIRAFALPDHHSWTEAIAMSIAAPGAVPLVAFALEGFTEQAGGVTGQRQGDRTEHADGQRVMLDAG